MRTFILSLLCLGSGIIASLAFAPINKPGIAILGISILFIVCSRNILRYWRCTLVALFFGIGYFSCGLYWIYNSIADYGHLSVLASALLTSLLILYLSLYPALMALLFTLLRPKPYSIASCLIFSALWCISEYCRATFFTGLPWLLLGHAQINSPLAHLIPILGVFGTSFITVLIATFLVLGTVKHKAKNYYLFSAVIILLSPLLLKNIKWTNATNHSIPVTIIQPNTPIRDEWDEFTLSKVLESHYQNISKNAHNNFVILPESAIPVPIEYSDNFIKKIKQIGEQKNSIILLGGLYSAENSPHKHQKYYNTLLATGLKSGRYFKQHLVPFGEYIPKPFKFLNRWVEFPESDIEPGFSNQILFADTPYALGPLICFEIAYNNILKSQLPDAKWLVSIVNDMWFGKSFAPFQQLQIARAAALMSGRYIVHANNNGLSAVIDSNGQILQSLPAFTDGILYSTVNPMIGSTPWVYFGDLPILLFCFALITSRLCKELLLVLKRGGILSTFNS